MNVMISNPKIVASRYWCCLAVILLIGAGAKGELVGTQVFSDSNSVTLQPRTSIVEYTAAEDHVGYVAVSGWDDGVLWLTYNLGQQGGGSPVTLQKLYSTDGGSTWVEPTGFFYHSNFGARNSMQLDDGQIVAINIGNANSLTTHEARFFTWPSSTQPYAETRHDIVFPFETTISTHRSFIEASDGSWLQSAYGKRDGLPVWRNFLLRSIDQGQSWSYFSDVMAPTQYYFESGPNETSMTVLGDGSILAWVRQGHGQLGPLMQTRSYDNGATWSTPTVLDADGGLDPNVVRLGNDTLVASYGRRDDGIFFLVDFSGTGNEWETLHLYEGRTSGYSSLVPVDDDRVMVNHDISGWGGVNLSSGALPNRALYQFIDVQPSILIGDIDGDGFVGINDLNIVLGNWNQNVPPANPLADPSGDGFVGIDDLNAVLGNWNAGTPPTDIAHIPEPTTAWLYALLLCAPRYRNHRSGTARTRL